MIRWTKTFVRPLWLPGMLLILGMVIGGIETAVLARPAEQTQPDVVSAEGRVVPARQVVLSFQLAGEVAKILVSEGQAVAAGAVLVQLDAAAAELGLAQAEARLALAESGLLAAEYQKALAETAGQTAQAGLTVAQANLALIQADPRPEQLAALENQVAAATAAVTEAVGNREAALNIAADSDILAAQAAVSAAQADVQRLEQAYEAILNSCFETPQGEVCPLFGPVEEQTRAQLTAARLSQSAAQAALESLEKGATPAQRQAANAAVSLAQAGLAVAQARLAVLQAGAMPEEVRLAEVAVEQAVAGIEQAQAGIEQAAALVAQAEAAVWQAEAVVASASLALERTRLRAPFAGTVVLVKANVGELIGPGLPVLTLANYGGWQIETIDLTELDVALVGLGDRVEVRIDALPEEEVMGQVAAVGLVPKLFRGDVVYPVTIDLVEAVDLPLRWGMTAFVDIEPDE